METTYILIKNKYITKQESSDYIVCLREEPKNDL